MHPTLVEDFPLLPAESAAADVSARVVQAGALLASILAHVVILAAVVPGPTPVRMEPEPLLRVVFVEPPPPPPPPATGVAPSKLVAKPVASIVEKPPKRVAQRPRRPLPVAEKRVDPRAPVGPVTEEPENSPAPTGVVGGVARGTEGGIVGGILGGRGSAPVPMGEVARPPHLLEGAEPEYPTLARRRGIEGVVRLEAVLDREGRIEEPIRVLESITALDRAAIDALRAWRFSPARDSAGDPVRVTLEVPIRFVLR